MSWFPRLLVIGLDGLNLDLIHRVLPVEVFPTLHALMAKGAAGALTSVFPTHSAAAWASFMTGQTPAEHGITDFKVRLPDGHYRHARPDPTSTLWHHLGQHGYRVGVFNFPVTYPPDPVNGWLVAGMLSPDLDRFTYPPDLAGKLRSAFPDYVLDVEWTLYAGRPADLLRDLTRMVKQRGEVARFLLEQAPVDCFAVAFIATDRAQHALWRFLDPKHPTYDPIIANQIKPALHGFYHALDLAIAGLMDKTGPETLVVLLSDHGFQAAAWQFHVDDWLRQGGWLVNDPGASRLERLVRRLDTPQVRQIRRRVFTDVSRHFTAFQPGGTINWKRTRAFCPWTIHQGVRINVRGRDPNGIVQPSAEFEQTRAEIAAALADLIHPETGERVVKDIYRSEAIFRGPYQEIMPDLVFEVQPNFASGPYRLNLFEPTGWASGDHSLDGFILWYGAGVQAGEISGSRLIDVTPTILKALGVPISDRITETQYPAIAPLITANPQPNAFDIIPASPVPETGNLTKEEESSLLEQLRNLGYL